MHLPDALLDSFRNLLAMIKSERIDDHCNELQAP
jgi:hypothetical protein